MDTLQLQPNEGKVFDMDFVNLLIGAEAISSVNSVGQEKWDEATEAWVASTDLTFSVPAISGALVQVHISGVVDDTEYKITILVTTDAATPNIHEGEGILVGIDL